MGSFLLLRLANFFEVLTTGWCFSFLPLPLPCVFFASTKSLLDFAGDGEDADEGDDSDQEESTSGAGIALDSDADEAGTAKRLRSSLVIPMMPLLETCCTYQILRTNKYS